MFPPSLGHVIASARAELLTQWFRRHLDAEVKIAVASDYGALSRAIATREIDLAWAPPIVCAAVQRSALAILKAVRGGQTAYRSALITRRGEGLDALDGVRAAWVDRLSTGGYLLPIAHLRGAGREPDHHLGEQVFAGSYARALRMVLEREADLSAVYVHNSTYEAAESSLREIVGDAAPMLEAVEFTDESPSDGLVIVNREDHQRSRKLLEQLRELTKGEPPSILLAIFCADALWPAEPGDYDVLMPQR